jgi:cytochrome c5
MKEPITNERLMAVCCALQTNRSDAAVADAVLLISRLAAERELGIDAARAVVANGEMIERDNGAEGRCSFCHADRNMNEPHPNDCAWWKSLQVSTLQPLGDTP